MEVEQLEHGRGRQDALAVPALEEDDVVAHVVGEVVALPFLFVKFISTAVWSMWILPNGKYISLMTDCCYLVDDEGCVPGEPELLCVRLELEINKADAAEGDEEQRGQDDFERMRGYRRPQPA